MIVERPMIEFLIRFLLVVRSRLKSRARLEAENIVLRQQVIVLSRKARPRVRLRNIDRLIFVRLCRMFPSILNAITVIKPETVIRWHRAGFGAYWRWRSRPHGGRPGTPHGTRELIRGMSIANPLCGAPRIHGELLKLGIDVGQTTVAKYMAKRRRPPSQGWRTFLHNHADGIASMDLFVVPTISFRLLYGLLILQHSRRQILCLGVTAHPTAEWIARQLTETYGWEAAPRYIIRDRDAIYGDIFTRRLHAMGIRDRPTAARSPWQNGYAEAQARSTPIQVPSSIHLGFCPFGSRCRVARWRGGRLRVGRLICRLRLLGSTAFMSSSLMTLRATSK